MPWGMEMNMLPENGVLISMPGGMEMDILPDNGVLISIRSYAARQ